MRCFSVENPSLIITRGRSSERKSLKRCVTYCNLDISFFVAICNSRYKRKFTNFSYMHGFNLQFVLKNLDMELHEKLF